MIKLKTVIKERDEILSKTKDDYTTREYNAACKRLHFLNDCVNYLESNPSTDFLQKEKTRLETRINKIQDEQPKFADNANLTEVKKVLKDYYELWKVPELKIQIKTIDYLLS